MSNQQGGEQVIPRIWSIFDISGVKIGPEFTIGVDADSQEIGMSKRMSIIIENRWYLDWIHCLIKSFPIQG